MYFRIEGDQIIVEKPDGEAILDAFLGAYEQRSLPDRVDWDEQAGSQAEKRFDRSIRGA